MIVMTMVVDSGVLVERGIFEVTVIFVAREKEGQGNVLRFLEEVVVAYLLEFSYVCLGRVISEIFLFPVSGHGPRGSSS